MSHASPLNYDHYDDPAGYPCRWRIMAFINGRAYFSKHIYYDFNEAEMDSARADECALRGGEFNFISTAGKIKVGRGVWFMPAAEIL